LINTLEWSVVDGPRVAFAWNERRAPGGPALRGFSTLVYAGDGCFSEYEGMFDTASLPTEWVEDGGAPR
jgi:hypothetical protein